MLKLNNKTTDLFLIIVSSVSIVGSLALYRMYAQVESSDLTQPNAYNINQIIDTDAQAIEISKDNELTARVKVNQNLSYCMWGYSSENGTAKVSFGEKTYVIPFNKNTTDREIGCFKVTGPSETEDLVISSEYSFILTGIVAK